MINLMKLMKLTKPSHITLLAMAALVLTGCTQPLNNRITLGGSYISPTFTTQARSQTPSLPDAQASRPRNQWTPIRYISPMDGVVHSPTWALTRIPKRTDPSRLYGRYPTIDDAALRTVHSNMPWINQTLFTIDELGRSFIGTPYAMGYLTVTGRLTKPMLSPTQNWKRTDQTQGWSTGYPSPIPDHTDDETDQEADQGTDP